jgi:nucleosome assembly protein 1-like 1
LCLRWVHRETIRSRLIPHAVRWYTGEANEEDEDEEEDEDGDDYDDEDDPDEDDEVCTCRASC